MNFGQRLIGVFTNPRETFSSLAEKPVWVDALILVLVVSFAFNFLIAPYSARDNYEMLQGSTKLKQQLGEERFNTMVEQARQKVENLTTAARITQSLLGSASVIIILLLQSLLLLVLVKFFSTQGSFVQLLSAMLHASFINVILGNGLRAFLASSKQSIFKVSTGLAAFFPTLEPTSSAYIILTSIDIFQLWMFGALAYGLSAIFKLELKKSIFISYLFWLLKTIVNIGLQIFSLSRI
ncbi:MAG: YIP1 family protein [Candidatus Aminicenantes bacterium]|nr:YIP1 family protein [Candidatus Aminicenantes bacterium]